MRIAAVLALLLAVPTASAQVPITEFQNTACNNNTNQTPPSGWTTSGQGDLSCGTLELAGAIQTARSGSHAFLTLTQTPNGTTVSMSQIVAPALGVGLPDRTVTFSAYTIQLQAIGPLDQDISQLRLEFLNNANAVVGSATNSPTLVPGAAWTLQSVEATAPAGATRVRVTAICTSVDALYRDNLCNVAWDDLALTTDAALPVELVAFGGVANGASARLVWTTASETNNLGFYVEQQTGEAWTERGFVAGRGTTTERSDYAFTLTGLSAGRHTFRLRQTDTDGSVHFSPTTSVEIAVGGEGRVTVLGQRAVRIETNVAQPVTVGVYDMLGRTVWAARADVAGTREVALPALVPGTYVVRVAGERFADSRTLVVR